MTPQEFFDFTVNAIRVQGRPSVGSDGRCQYRGYGGAKCAAGLHITDAEYLPEMEGVGVRYLCEKGRGVQLPAVHVLRDHSHLARALQAAHDNAASVSEGAPATFMAEFEQSALYVANDYHLQYKAAP